MPPDPIILAISLLLAGSALIAALVVAVKALRLSREGAGQHHFERLQNSLAGLTSRLGALEQRASEVFGKDASPPAQDRILLFLQALERWRKIVPGGSVLPVGSGVRELESVRGSNSSALSFGEEPIDVDQLFFEIVKTVVSNSDNTLDKRRKNREMQTALRELVSRAGLQLLEPAPDDPVDPEFHFVINTVRGNGRNQNTIEDVLSRGLTRSGRIAQKAEVVSRF